MTSTAKKRRSTVIVKLPEKRESLRDKLRRHFKEVAPYLLHLGIVLGVTLYVLVGAYAIREIESLGPGEVIETDETTTLGPETSRIRRAVIESTADMNRLRKQSMNRTRRCVIAALHRLRQQTNCSKDAIERANVGLLDDCYEKDVKRIVADAEEVQIPSKTTIENGMHMGDDGWRRWSVTESVLFCFTVITTIGYGNVAPRKFEGRLFVIFYGLIGVPFTMLAIANLGKFLAALLKSWTRPIIKCCGRIHRRCFRKSYSAKERQRLMDAGKKSKLESTGDEDEEEEEGEEEGEESSESSTDAFILFVSFVLYVIIGSFVISLYEPKMGFFEAVYFNFVTLTTIGLGDLVPQSDTFLLATLIYCAVGLALTTIAIEIAADYLKKLHYFGRKMENVGQVKVWFGGQQISMRQLVKNLGDQFNVPVDQLQDLNLEQFVDNAMRVEAGELSTLRTEPKPYESSDYWRAIEGSMLHFVDDDDVIAAQAAQSLRRSISWSVDSPSIRREASPRQARQMCSTNARRAASSASPRPVAKPNPPMVGVSKVSQQRDERRQQMLKTWKERMMHQSSSDSEDERERYSTAARVRLLKYQSEWQRFRMTKSPEGDLESPRKEDEEKKEESRVLESTRNMTMSPSRTPMSEEESNDDDLPPPPPARLTVPIVIIDRKREDRL
ncbi:hypothetical protein PFISCL1PPCAC_17467 [Pristionchus fissidentatus]|uniref:Potassium channel domain-containing protein n=1 Tax=Pristionchus fissidentatus TaxID=1538716 RepID=A0AAV5W693_9BILA|nr:hypothetical protein PFISCL1PPCAC_17467 [Pristionchus fissidentatus]